MAGAKVLGLPRTPLIIAGVAFTAALAWIAWKRHTAAAAPPADTTATTDSGASDTAGQLSVIQTELESLLAMQGAQGVSSSAGGGGFTSGPVTAPPGTAPGIPSALPPAGFSVTPHPGSADFGWSATPGAKYELQVAGAGGKGTGTSHYDQVLTGNHARVPLQQGRYTARVRVFGPQAGAFTGARSFTVAK